MNIPQLDPHEAPAAHYRQQMRNEGSVRRLINEHNQVSHGLHLRLSQVPRLSSDVSQPRALPSSLPGAGTAAPPAAAAAAAPPPAAPVAAAPVYS